MTASWAATNTTTPCNTRGSQFPAKFSQMTSHFWVPVHLLLCPRVGAVGECVREVVVERTKAVEEKEVVGVEERDCSGKV